VLSAYNILIYIYNERFIEFFLFGLQQNMSQICQRHGCRKQALRKFCSVACRVAHHNSRRAPASKVRITCQGCGKVFQGRPDQKTCGATCRSRLFRAQKQQGGAIHVTAGPRSVEWGALTPFSPAELRQKMQKQQLEPGVEYSWLPANPKKVRVRRPKPHTDQMRLDFGLNEPDSEDQN